MGGYSAPERYLSDVKRCCRLSNDVRTDGSPHTKAQVAAITPKNIQYDMIVDTGIFILVALFTSLETS
jgi:hypothetical protein